MQHKPEAFPDAPEAQAEKTQTEATQTDTHDKKSWTFLTNHAHVLVCLARQPGVRLRDVAQLVGITERAVQRIIADLKEAGYITPSRDGRRNHYEVHKQNLLRHPVESGSTVAALLASLDKKET